MPNRLLREGILTSPRLARLGWAEEVLYRRLMSVVDDFGRYYADPGMLRAACYPRQLSKVSDSDVGKWLAQVAEAGLVRVYPAQDGESYLELVNFGQQVRAKKSKFPDPPSDCNADAAHMRSRCSANARLDVFVDEDVDEDESAGADAPAAPRKRAAPQPQPSRPEDVDAQVWSDWLAIRRAKKAPLTHTAMKQMASEVERAGLTLDAALRICCTRGWAGFKAEWTQNDRQQFGSQRPAPRRPALDAEELF